VAVTVLKTEDRVKTVDQDLKDVITHVVHVQIIVALNQLVRLMKVRRIADLDRLAQQKKATRIVAQDHSKSVNLDLNKGRSRKVQHP
jgi:predicted GTPase